jgi:hypothetical protein
MKKLLQKISLLWKKITGKSKKFIQDHVEPAIKVVNLVKDAVENPAMSILVALTPFGWDDEAVKLAKKILPKVLLELNILKDASGGSNVDMLKAIIAEIRTFTPDSKAEFYEDLAVKLSVMLSDGKLSVSEAAELVKFVYDEKFKQPK